MAQTFSLEEAANPQTFSLEDALQTPPGAPQGATTFSLEEAMGVPTPQPPEEVPDASTLESLADIGLGISTGFVNILGSVADATVGADSATSAEIKRASEHLQGLLSAEGQADKEKAAAILKDAEDKGLMAGIQAGLQAVAADPSGMISQGVGSAVPFIATGLLTGLPGLMTLGGVSGAGIVKGEIYQAVEAELLKQGEDPTKAAEVAAQAQEYGGENLDQILFGGGLGILASVGPVERLGMMKSLKGGILARLGKGAVAEAVPEAIQAGQEAAAGNIALQREGFDVDTFRGVAGAATSEGLVGGLIGGPISMVAGPRAEDSKLTGDDTSPETLEDIAALVEASRRTAAGEDLDAQEQAELDDVVPPSAEPDVGGVEPSVPPFVEPGPETVEDVTPAPLPTEPEGVGPTGAVADDVAGREPDVNEALRVSDEMAEIEAELAGIEADFDNLVEDATNLGQTEAEAVKEITDTQIEPRRQKLRELRTQAVATGQVEGRRTSDEELGVGPRPKAGRRGVQDIDPEQAATQAERQLQKPKKLTKKAVTTQAQEDFSAAGSQVTPELLDKAEQIRQTDGDALAVTYLERLGVLERKRQKTASKQITPPQESKKPQTKIQEAFVQAKAKMEAEETPAEEQVADTGLQPKGKDPEKEASRKASQAINRDTDRLMDQVQVALDIPVPTQEQVLEDAENLSPSALEKRVAELEAQRAQRVFALAEAVKVATNPRTRKNKAGIKAKQLLEHPSVMPDELTEARARAEREPNIITATGKVYGVDPAQDGSLDEAGVARADIVDDTSVATNDEINPELGQFDRAPALLDYIIQTGNKFEQLLARRIKKAVADVRIVVIKDLDNDVPGKYRKEFEGRNAARGIYVHDTRTVYINDTRARASGLTNTIMLHELVHGATLGVLGTRATEILTDNNNLMGSTTRTAVDFLRDLMVDARGVYLEMKAKGLTTPREDRLYEIGAFDDLNEFVAYGFTQPEMQDFLSGIPGAFNKVYAKRGNLWSQFIGAIRKIFNIPDSDANAFTDLITLGDILIDAPFIDATPTDMVQAAKKVKELRDSERRVLEARNVDQATTAIGDMVKASTTNWSKAKEMFASKWNSMTTPTIQGLNLFLTADQLADWAASVGLGKIKEVNEIIQKKMNPAKFQMMEELQRNVDLWNAFNKKYPLLLNPVSDKEFSFSDFLNYVTLEGIDPSQYKDLNDALQNRPEILAAKKAVTDAEKAGNSARSIATLRGKVTEIENDTRALFKRWDEIGSKTETVTRKRPVRDANFKEIKLPNGEFKTETVTMPEAHFLFEAVRDYYYDLYVKRKALLEEQVRNSGLEGNENDPATPLGRAMEGLRETFANADKVKIYFPLMRYGRYWARIGRGKAKKFALFESQADRDQYIKNMYQALKEQGESLSQDELVSLGFIDFGNSTENFEGLLNNLSPGDQGAAILRKVDSTLKEQQDKTQGLDKDAVELLRNQVFQMYLMTLPDRDIRKRFSPRKGTAGFSRDGLRGMVVNGVAAANQLSRLEYGSEVRRKLEEAEALVKASPSIEESNKKDAILQAFFGRVKKELNPEYDESILDKMAIFGNQTSFLMLLTSMKSAAVQFTQLPIVGTPVLAARYGFAKTTTMMGNYAMLFNKLGMTKRDPKTGEIITRFGQPSIGDSKYVEKKPHLRKAWEWGHRLNYFQDNLAADVAERTDKPTDIYDSGLSKAGRTVYRFMTGAFYHAERIAREIMFMSAFELEYDRLKKQGKSDEDAFAEGVEVAYKLADEALFNYNRFNKPPIMKDYPVGRVAFQFMTYTQQMVAFMYKNFKGMLPFLNKEGKKEAATKFFGTMMMTGFVFSGLTGLPLYSIIMNTLTALRDPEDDDGLEDRNLDIWFRAVWIPSVFGEGSDLAKLLNLDAEDSRMLERVAEMGLISAVTDLNIGSSTSLDTLFFASDNLGRDTRSQLQEFVFTNLFGPTGSLVLGAIDGVEDIQNGEVTRGLEKFTPAMFRGAVKNLRLMEQGEMARTGAIVGDFNREFFAANPEKLAGQAFGFASTEVSQQQKRNILLKRMEIELKKKRQQVLNRLNAASNRLNANPTQDNIDEYNERLNDVDEYNRTIGKFLYITNETLDKSLNNKAKKIAEAYRGLVIDKNLAPFVESLQIKPRP